MKYFIMTLSELSLLASVMALIVLCIRLFVKNAPKIYTYILWIFVFIRAVLPISYASAFSLQSLFLSLLPAGSGKTAAPAENVLLPAAPDGLAHFAPNTRDAVSQAAAFALPRTAPQKSLSLLAAFQDPWILAAAIWLAVTVFFLCAGFASARKLRKTVAFSTLSGFPAADRRCRVYESDQIRTAFVLGFFRPAIYLPAGLSDSAKRLILEHEFVHVRRHDHQIKIAAWLVLALHWFNPLMWASYFFLNKDMELSCDEQVIRNLGSQERADYGSLLLSLAVAGRLPSGAPLAFSKGDAKARIKNILNYRPLTLGSSAFAMLCVLLALYGCMGAPKTGGPDAGSGDAAPGTELSVEQATEEPAADSPELAFAKNFIDCVVSYRPEEIYAMLSPALKEQADNPVQYGDLGLWRGEKEKHCRINPFIPDAAPVIEKTDTGFRYAMRREDSPATSGNRTEYYFQDTWEGEFSLEQAEDGSSFQVSEWTENICNEIRSFEEYHWFDREFDYPSRFLLDLAGTTDLSNKLSLSYREPEDMLLEEMRLAEGEIADKQMDEDGKKLQITYRWDDGSVTFLMEKVGKEGIWAIAGTK